MTRITSFNLPKKSFVSSAAEESQAGPSTSSTQNQAEPKKKSKRRGRRGKTEAELAASDTKAATTAQRGFRRLDGPRETGGWKKDPSIAKRAKYAAERAEERRQSRMKQRESSTTCFACRSVGHSARDCPNVLLATEGPQGTAEMLGDTSAKANAGSQAAEEGTEESGEKPKKGMKRKKGKLGADLVGGKCYRCDSTTHSLHHCLEPIDLDNPTPFATCYICLGRGHLASLCPNNAGKGIYVNGGSCKVCGSTAHRAKDCPDLPQREGGGFVDRRGDRRGRELVVGVQGGADEDDWMVQSRSMARAGDGREVQAPKRNATSSGRPALGPQKQVERRPGSIVLESSGKLPEPTISAPTKTEQSLAGKAKPKMVKF